MYVCMLVPESAKVHACLSPLHRHFASGNRHKCCSYITSSVTQLRRAAFLLGLQHDSRVVRILEKLALLCFSRVTTLCVDVCSYGWAWAAKMLLSSSLGAISRLKTLRLLFTNTQNNPPKESHEVTVWTLREARGPMFYGALSEWIRSSYSSFPHSLIGEVWRNLDYNSTENHLMVKLRISLSAKPSVFKFTSICSICLWLSVATCRSAMSFLHSCLGQRETCLWGASLLLMEIASLFRN